MTTPAPAQRMVGPDLARGLTLLGIALANAATAWSIVDSRPFSVGFVRPDNLFDSLSVMIFTIGVDKRGLPMFATLLGYGVGLIYARCAREGMTLAKARKTLVRRYLFLALFGLIHMVLVFYGDIMFLYALIVLLLIPLVHLKDKALLWIAGVLAPLGALAGFFTQNPFNHEGFVHVAAGTPFAPFDAYTDQLGIGLFAAAFMPIYFLLAVLQILPIVIIGFVAGRRNLFAQSERYRTPMIAAMIVSAVIALGVGVPWGLAILGGADPATDALWWAINQALGYFTGPGTVVMFFYLGNKLSGTKATTVPPLCWVLSLGRMSMSGYVLQSLVFTIVVAPWGLGIGSQAPIAVVLATATGVWLITVLAAGLWPKQHGPLETLHRRLSYPPQKEPERLQPA